MACEHGRKKGKCDSCDLLEAERELIVKDEEIERLLLLLAEVDRGSPIKRLIKVTFVPKRSSPIPPEVYLVDVVSFARAELSAAKQLSNDNLSRRRYNPTVMSYVNVLEG